jgi:peptide/nickel transport system substrate-binding protein
VRRLLALLGLALLLCAPAHAKDTLTIGITQFPSTFHPNIDEMLAKSYILSATRRPFTTHDPDWQLMCMLCVELPTLENGQAKREQAPDGKHGMAVTFRIQPNARWGDGAPITSDDVIFTWRAGRHPKSGFSGEEFYRRVYKVTPLDAKTFTLHFDKVFFDYNSIGGFEVLPAHLEEKIFDERPEEYRNRTNYVTNPTNPGLYFGPYRIAQVTPGSHVVLEPNETWWGAKPYFKRLTVRAIENTAALEANLLSSAIDMIDGDLGLAIDEAIAFEKRHGARYAITYKPGLIYEHIDLNLSNPILADARVRRALLHGIDRVQIAEKLFGGRQPVAHTNVNALDWIHTDEIPKYPFDAKRAAALLDEAGWTMKAGGVRQNAKGERLSLELMSTAGNRSRELVQQVLQSQWKDLGVDIRIRNQPARVFFGETVTQRKFEAMAMFAWISAPESVPRSNLHSQHIPTADNGWSGQNYTGFRNPEADRLIEAIEVELDREARRGLWHELQRLYASELPVLPLYFRANAYILPKWLKGVTPTGHLGTTTLRIEEWRE